jgi:hypothetical protein
MNTDLLKRSPDLRAVADMRLMSMEDGPGRGQRILVGRNAVGIGFEVAVDRGLDISALSKGGTNIGWHSPTQMPFPTADAGSEGGWAFLRNFDGFMVTCGLDHFSRPREVDVSHYNHPHLKAITPPLHGRISTARAKILAYGVDPDTGEISCEGVVRQASVFGETLELRRRISLPIDATTLTVEDVVINRGFRPTRHGILYHLNFGYPFLDEALKFLGLPAALASALAQDRPVPADDYGERVENVESREIGGSGVTLMNSVVGLAVNLRFSGETLPRFAVWRAYQSGVFALGLEPKTEAADERPLLEPGNRINYRLELALSDLA